MSDEIVPMSMVEKAQHHKLKVLAENKYPGIVGLILSDYIDSWIEFGYRLGDTARFTQLYKHLVPDEDKKPADTWVEIV